MHKLLNFKLCLREINRNSFHMLYIDMLLIFMAKNLCCVEHTRTIHARHIYSCA